MNKKLLWELFKKTGKIEYYIKYKKIDGENEWNQEININILKEKL